MFDITYLKQYWNIPYFVKYMKEFPEEKIPNPRKFIGNISLSYVVYNPSTTYFIGEAFWGPVLC